MRLLYETPHLTIQQDAADDCLFLMWRGHHPTALIEATGEIILQQIRRTRSRCLLNDASLDMGGWEEFIAWFGRVIYPELTSSGIEALAWVLPHNLRALTDTKNVLNLIEQAPNHRPDRPEINTFGDVELASRWLHTMMTQR